MSGETIKIRANGGGEFDCYVIAPKGDTPVPAIVLASAIHGARAILIDTVSRNLDGKRRAARIRIVAIATSEVR